MQNDILGIGFYLGYFAIAVVIAFLVLRVFFKAPFEITRKVLHLIIVLSIFPLLTFFSRWYMAVLAAILLVALAYPALLYFERKSSPLDDILVERKNGEFKNSLIIVQLTMSILITFIWGMLGTDWKYVALVAVLAWGFGDAAAALIGKAFGRNKISHPKVDGGKTYEGTFAMFSVAWMTIFLTLSIYSNLSLSTSFIAATIVAPVAAIVELFSHKGMDTITVPLGVAFTLLPLIMLFSLTGI